MENPGELWSDIFSLILCSLPSVPPKVTVSCQMLQKTASPVFPCLWPLPLLHPVSPEEGLGAR